MQENFENAIRRIAERCGFYVRRRNSQTDPELHIATIVNHFEIDMVLDVGANIGQFARSLRSNGYLGRIISFEPHSEAHDALETVAGRDPAWTIAPRVALGDFAGEAMLNISRNSVSSSLLSLKPRHQFVAGESVYVGAEPVSVVTLDSLALQDMTAATAAYLKIDTQGFEKKVLAGASQVLKSTLAVQMELSLVELYAGQPLYEEMITYMKERGFYLFALQPGFSDREMGQTLQFDAVFVTERRR